MDKVARTSMILRIIDEICENRWMVEWKVIAVGFLVLFNIVLNLIQLMGK